MARLSQYPKDPTALVPGRGVGGRYSAYRSRPRGRPPVLAYSSVPDPDDPANRPMLGRDGQHWGFLFNSEASLLEGTADSRPGVGADRPVRHGRDRGGLLAARPVPDGLARAVRGARHVLRRRRAAHPFGIYNRSAASRSTAQRRDVSAADVAKVCRPPHPGPHGRAEALPLRLHPAHVAGADPSRIDARADRALPAAVRAFFREGIGRPRDGRGDPAALVEALALSGRGRGRRRVGDGHPYCCDSAGGSADGRAGDVGSGGEAARIGDDSGGATTVSFSYSGDRARRGRGHRNCRPTRHMKRRTRVSRSAGAAELRLVQVSAGPAVVRLTDANGLVYAGARISRRPHPGHGDACGRRHRLAGPRVLPLDARNGRGQ